jgi:D-alanine-D-alanine ligase
LRIAFTHNLQLTDSEEEAEFDRPDTVQAIAKSLSRLGHEVELVEVSGPASQLVARLEALNPHLIFNTAEGRNGRFREAFYPALFDQLGLPYTGSDSYTCLLTLDKMLTKQTLAAHGIPTPRWAFVTDLDGWTPPHFTYPVIVKPNFEGSSKGITQDSVVETPVDLVGLVKELLSRYPSGLLIEEYIEGRDIAVPFLEAVKGMGGGILPAAEYIFDLKGMKKQDRRYSIYDYNLKHVADERVTLVAPAELSAKQRRDLTRWSAMIFKLLGIRDIGRIDFRVAEDGKLYFIELNALPSLDVGSGIYVSAEAAGLKDMDAVLKAIIKSAAARYGIEVTKRTHKNHQSYRVGVTYNQKRIVPKSESDDDTEAEYDSPKTIHAIGDAIASYGHEVIYLEATAELPAILASSQLDLVFNIAEGFKGRSRESQVPAILELLDIQYTGSDPATLAVALDKALAKRVVRQAGIPTPEFILLRTGKERLPRHMRFPVIIKPNAEGSSKGVVGVNVVEDEAQLRELAIELINKYHQPVLVEEYLPGREFTLGLLGEYRPKVLPPMEIVYLDPNVKRPVYTFGHKLDYSSEIRYEAPAVVDKRLRAELERVGRSAFMALGCSDVARIDVRLDARGKVHFIECNPLPGLTPGWSDLCLIAEAAGMDYRTLVGAIMAPSLRRMKARRRAQVVTKQTN